MKKNRNGLSYAAVLALVLVFLTPVFAQNIRVQLDGSLISFGSVPPANVNGRVLVPLRGVFEALGAIVDYQASTRTVLAAKDTTNLKLQIGSATAYVNGNPVTLDVPAQVVLGRTLVPLRFVSEAMGAQVAWNPASQTVSITSPPQATPPPSNPSPVFPPYNPPANPPADQTVTGTVSNVSTDPPTITVDLANRSTTYDIARSANILLQPQLNNGQTTRSSSISLNQISNGEEVSLTVNRYNKVTQIAAMPEMVFVPVRRVEGSTLILDDPYGTRVTIGNNVQYVNPRGQILSSPDVRAGDTVVLFINGHTIYRVSADPNDVRVAGGTGGGTTEPPYNPRGNNVPRIESVRQDAVAPLNAGSSIQVTVRGTAGLQGSFDLSQNITNIPLRENNPGVYVGNYNIRPGDDVYQGYVTAHLSSPNGYTVSQQSQDPFTIDTKAPLIISTRPGDGATVDVAQPNIIIYTDDQGGSGLAPTTLTLRNAGRTYRVEGTVAPPQSIRAVVPEELSGLVDVIAEVRDNAGNVTPVNFHFTIEANTGPIRSINHNATRALTTGDSLTVDMTAPAGGRASFDLVSQDNAKNVVVQGIPMTEIEPRHYRGIYNVTGIRDVGMLTVVGRFRDRNGNLDIKDATAPVEIVGKRENDAPTIDNLRDGDTVTSPLTIRGSAQPQNIVEVRVVATGSQYYILPYQQDLGTFRVTSNNRGKWNINGIDLPSPKNISGLKYTVTAVQQDSNEQTSPETTVTVRPQ